MKTLRIVYWIATVLFCSFMLYSAGIYFTKTEMMRDGFLDLGYPAYLVLPLGVLKLTGVYVILHNRWKSLKEWAYAGFVINISLAITAHLAVQDGHESGAMMALILVLISYIIGKIVRP